MEDFKDIISKNLIYLRKKNNLTQLELAEKINYSDNAISRWERGEVTPSIEILQILAGYYKIRIVDLFDESFCEKDFYKPSQTASRVLTITFCISIVWMINLLVYIYLNTFLHINFWIIFVFGAPVSAGVTLFFNRKYGNKLISIILSSFLIWSLFLSVYLYFLKYNLWHIFLLGIPSQFALISGYFLKSPNLFKKSDNKKD